jgi:hypothetical protein
MTSVWFARRNRIFLCSDSQYTGWRKRLELAGFRSPLRVRRVTRWLGVLDKDHDEIGRPPVRSTERRDGSS